MRRPRGRVRLAAQRQQLEHEKIRRRASIVVARLLPKLRKEYQVSRAATYHARCLLFSTNKIFDAL